MVQIRKNYIINNTKRSLLWRLKSETACEQLALQYLTIPILVHSQLQVYFLTLISNSW